MATYHSGKNAKVVSNGVSLPNTQWSAVLSSELIDVTNALGNGFAEFIPGVLSGTISFTVLWDSDNVPAGTPGIAAGASITFAGHCANTGKTVAGTVIVGSSTYTGTVRATAFNVAVSGNFTGAFTEPTS